MDVMDAGTLNDAIAGVSPIDNCTVGKSDDRATWKWTPGVGATQPQIDAGNNVIATIPITPLTTVSPGGLILRFTNGEYKATLDYHTSSLAAGTIGPKKTWDTMMGDSINMNDRTVKSVKNGLVSASVLTQARADVIFS
jgi:hypothetical protein